MKGEVSWGSYFDHALAWEQRMDDPHVKVITYEELKQDLSSRVADISSFFGFSLTQDQVQQVAEGSTFRAMKENAGNTHATIGNVIFKKVRLVTGRTTSQLNKAKRWTRSSRSSWLTPNWEPNSTTSSSVSRRTPAAPPDL
uniref:Sulfotransferase n=1 Tax=Tetraodon nigroviridis TaxID=99883 RepID=H3CNY6_TETNG